MTIKRRGKKKTLFKTVESGVLFSAGDTPAKRKLDIQAFKAIAQRGTLKAQLASHEETARKILKQHGLKYTGHRFIVYVGDYDLPLPASYAADILFSIKGVREFIKNGDAQNAASEALKLGWNVAALQAELATTTREGTRTSTATGARKCAKEMRQERIKDIAIETGWQPGRELRKKQLQQLYTVLRERHPEYKNKPSDQTLSDDALKIGLRKKK